jgi:hypothetical protein
MLQTTTLITIHQVANLIEQNQIVNRKNLSGSITRSLTVIPTQSEAFPAAFTSGGVNVASEVVAEVVADVAATFFGSLVFLPTLTPMSKSGSTTV